MDQIASAMQNIGDTTNHNLASTEQVKQAAKSFGALGQKLKDIVAAYKVDDKS